jgi:muramoyltetrapeptide carboxypeptidase
VRGGYGSAEVLPLLDPDVVRASRAAFIGYSDLTAIHAWLNTVVGITSIHGPMIEGRLARGADAVDLASFTASLATQPVGALEPAGLEVLRGGEAAGVLYGGTITQILASFGTPFEFAPPAGHILFLDEVGERPYRLRRMLTQLKQSGRLAEAAALVFGQMPRCDEPGGAPTARATIADAIADFEGPVLYGFPSGHSTTPLVTIPFGVGARVLARERPALVIEEAAAG